MYVPYYLFLYMCIQMILILKDKKKETVKLPVQIWHYYTVDDGDSLKKYEPNQ